LYYLTIKSFPDNIIFNEDISNIINGKGYIASAEKDHAIQYEVVSFIKYFLAESDIVFLAGENNTNNMDLTNIGLNDSILDYVEGKYLFCWRRRNEPYTKKSYFHSR
jgi:hypothetical protein